MENSRSPRTARRAIASASGAQSRTKAEAAPTSRHVARSMGNTLLAFTTLTAATPLMPALLRPLRLPAAGMIYADLQQQPSGIGFAPRPSRRQERIGLLISLFPFIPAYALQTWVSEVRCMDAGSTFARIARRSEEAWKAFWHARPGSFARQAERYPINFTLARGFWQMVAAATGAVLAVNYHRSRGAELVSRTPRAPAPTLSQRVARRPETYLQAGLFFSVPALLDSAAVRKMLHALPAPKLTSNLVGTCSLVAAAATTSIVARSKQ
jgi:hypothetical protein